MKKIDWTEIDGLVASLRLSCGNAAAIATRVPRGIPHHCTA
jgi:hypothetical protein